MPPPLTPEELFAHLDALGIAHRTYSHPPVFTVAEATALRGSLPGGHCKSLFLKDKKGGFWLAVMLEERRIDLKKLAARLPAPRFSFGGADDLYRLLGVRPGSVTPFALLNDVGHLVIPVLDAAMLESDPLNYHPLENDRTTAISPADLLRLIEASGHVPRILRSGRPRARTGYSGDRTPPDSFAASVGAPKLVLHRSCRHVVGQNRREKRCRVNL
jgi:Ala-tRNA(Pro) deacylase